MEAKNPSPVNVPALKLLRGNPETAQLLQSFEKSLLHEAKDGDESQEWSDAQHLRNTLSEDDAMKQLQEIVLNGLRNLSKEGEGLIFEHHVNTKEKIIKVVSFIRSVQDFITTAVSADPHASLAWAGMLVILPIMTRTVTEETDAIDGFNGISNILIRSRVIEQNYFAKPTESA
ncbi:hypothetical protein BO71DRAFT_487255 [Aspergillus ellipticus CBS 707.79]|uniref:NWD NACHT-NTPase N-terminal domain-containing protein n=1 Tax=Aspergillus ellipticus CBS 707.79 TaxID=1448320 RepID=A0A319D6W4_9EURO|nr:hypothetical protein BO71DRAFT_487255 [Aspergillus ellipticus CBS 707.79]